MLKRFADCEVDIGSPQAAYVSGCTHWVMCNDDILPDGIGALAVRLKELMQKTWNGSETCFASRGAVALFKHAVKTQEHRLLQRVAVFMAISSLIPCAQRLYAVILIRLRRSPGYRFF